VPPKDLQNFHISTDFSVIHEDDDILVIEKPAPLAVHAVGAYAEMNLHSILKRDMRWQESDVRFVHRLDAETSGVILAAKHEAAARFMGLEFLNQRVAKTYRALVHGVPPHAEGEITHRLGTDASSGFQTVRVRDDKNGEDAHTRYRLVYTDGRYSMLELVPLTGRTHQIRAHLSMLGNPIVGDKIYNDLNIFREYVISGMNEAMLDKMKLRRMALHATRLVFRHPGTKEHSEFRSPCPAFLSQVLQCPAPAKT
jgi:RluA family pseudouridine synthase